MNDRELKARGIDDEARCRACGQTGRGEIAGREVRRGKRRERVRVADRDATRGVKREFIRSCPALGECTGERELVGGTAVAEIQRKLATRVPGKRVAVQRRDRADDSR